MSYAEVDVIGDAVLFRGDCLAVMPSLPKVDMILADLPYGTTQNKWDSVIPLAPLWEQYRRVTKPTAAIVLTGMQPFTSALVNSGLAMFSQALVWKKNIASNFLNASRQHLVRHEDVLVFCAKQPTFNRQFAPGKPYKQARSGRDDTGDNYGAIAKRTDTVNDGTRNPISVLEFDRERRPQHPTQKPVALMEYLIRTYTEPGAIVLDNTMGSGTTGVAALRCGRRFIGIEQDEKYFAVARERIGAERAAAPPAEERDIAA